MRALTGRASQGSFGAPALNDKGSVAYSAILSGNGVGSLTSYSIVFRKKSRNAQPKLVLQGGTPRLGGYAGNSFTLNNNFLLNSSQSSTYPRNGSGNMFRLSRSIGLNNKDIIGFAGEAIWTQVTDSISNGQVTDRSFVRRRTAVYGAIRAGSGFYANLLWNGDANQSGDSSTRLKNTALSVFENYFADILQKNVTINNQNSIVYNASFIVTPEEEFPGFAWSSPSNGLVVATTASNVIGLPYFTTFNSFTDAVIADQNRCFVVADLTDEGDEFDGIWQGNNSDLQPVTVIGRSTPAGGTYESFEGVVGPSKNGKLVGFIASVSGGNINQGVFRTNLQGQNAKLIAAAGRAAPGTNGNFDEFSLVGVSNRGHVAIFATITNSGSGSSARQGIWISDPSGENLELIALEGQDFDIGSVEKRITRLTFNPLNGLNRSGQVAFTASFNDRTSAVIVARR